MDYNATKTAQDLALTYSDYNFLMGLAGLSVGVIFFFFLTKILIQIGRGY